MVDFNSRIVVLALRITQVIFAIVVLGLTAYGRKTFFKLPPVQTNKDTVSHWWSSYWHAVSPSQINFLIFDSVWTFLALCYLIIVPWRFSETKLHHKFAILAVEGVTTIFWFAGFIALAIFLSDRMCYGNVCSAAKAATVFAAFEW